MKKILIFVSTAIFAFALLPLLGNKLAQESLEKKIKSLQANGIEVKNTIIEYSYFSTSRHYEFMVQDMDKFLQYLNSYSDEQLPAYVDAIVDGVIIGSDLQYSNFPFAKAISVDIYPLTISESMKKSLEKEDKDFYNYIDKFLKNRGVLYHVNYNLLSKDFDGFIKNINENYTLKDSTKLHFELSNAIYSGNGELIAPSQLISSIQNISLSAFKDTESLKLNLKNFSSSSNFESQTTYLSSAKLKSLELNATSKENDILFSISEFYADISSNTQGDKAQVYAKSSVKDFVLNSKEINIQSSDFNYDISLNDLDKDSFEALRVTITQMQNKDAFVAQEKIQESVTALLSKGLKFNIADFSIKNIALEDNQNLGGFSLVATTNLKEDKDLAQKIKHSPIFVAQSIESDIKFKLSKKIFDTFSDILPMVQLIKSYAKEDTQNLIFDISFKNQELKINDKSIYK